MAITVDLDIVRKYDRPGPRYTSYPTAPHFKEGFEEREWSALIGENNLSGERPLSLYFHFPFCDTLCWFCGCTMLVSRRRDQIETYLQTLFDEIELLSPMLHEDRRVVQMHFGGGTPTHLDPDQLVRVGDKIRSRFRFAPDAEIACEMDPRGLTREHLHALRQFGANRASLGIQDFKPEVQKAVNRVHDEALVGQVIDWIRAEGFESLNLDLIYGLPFQTPESFEETIETVLSFSPDRLAVFSYAHVPWLKPHQKLIREEDMPSPKQKLAMLKLVIEMLTQRGYVYIGMDHFARENDELFVAQKEGMLQRNFQGYSTKAGADIYALGMSSISQLETAYAQNFKNLKDHHTSVRAGHFPVYRGYVLSEDDRIRRHVIMRLMCDMGLDFRRIDTELGIDSEAYFRDELDDLEELEEDGLLERTSEGLLVTETGRLLVRNIAMKFDAYLETSQARYSKTV